MPDETTNICPGGPEQDLTTTSSILDETSAPQEELQSKEELLEEKIREAAAGIRNEALGTYEESDECNHALREKDYKDAVTGDYRRHRIMAYQKVSSRESDWTPYNRNSYTAEISRQSRDQKIYKESEILRLDRAREFAQQLEVAVSDLLTSADGEIFNVAYRRLFSSEGLFVNPIYAQVINDVLARKNQLEELGYRHRGLEIGAYNKPNSTMMAEIDMVNTNHHVKVRRLNSGVANLKRLADDLMVERGYAVSDDEEIESDAEL